MKRFVLLAFILCCFVQAQTIGTWVNASDVKKSVIYTINIDDKSTALYIRCTGELLEMFFNVKYPITKNPEKPIIYKTDSGIVTTSYQFDTNLDNTVIFFLSHNIKETIKSFLYGHYFSVVIESADRFQSYTFDLTGFGQAVKALPCALKILNPTP